MTNQDTAKITTGFPRPTVDPILGLPTYVTIKELHVQLNANAASIFTNLGDGQHGYLRLTVSDAQYNSVSAVPFVAPVNPGATVTYPFNATSARTRQADDAHDKAYRLFKDYTLADKALKQLFLGAIEEKYYRVLRNDLIGYANVTTRDLIKHFYTGYGDITSAQLADNDVKLRSVYDPNQPIESLYEQIDNAIAFATSADNEYTDKHTVSIGYAIKFQTGVYADGCKVWRKKLEADKTWPTFKTFFTNANQDLRQSKATTASTGYHPAVTIYLQHTLNTLTTAIESDQSTITNMTAHNNHLTQQLTQAIVGLGTATDNIATLQSQLNALTYNGRGGGRDGGSVGGNRYTGTGTSGGGASANTPDNKKSHRFDFNRKPKHKVYNNNNYCYKHGYISLTAIQALLVLIQAPERRRTRRALTLWEDVLGVCLYAYDR